MMKVFETLKMIAYFGKFCMCHISMVCVCVCMFLPKHLFSGDQIYWERLSLRIREVRP